LDLELTKWGNRREGGQSSFGVGLRGTGRTVKKPKKLLSQPPQRARLKRAPREKKEDTAMRFQKNQHCKKHLRGGGGPGWSQKLRNQKKRRTSRATTRQIRGGAKRKKDDRPPCGLSKRRGEGQDLKQNNDKKEDMGGAGLASGRTRGNAEKRKKKKPWPDLRWRRDDLEKNRRKTKRSGAATKGRKKTECFSTVQNGARVSRPSRKILLALKQKNRLRSAKKKPHRRWGKVAVPRKKKGTAGDLLGRGGGEMKPS